MRFNLGLTGVIATTMLLLASTTNAAITTTDSSLSSGRQGHTLSRRNTLGYILCGNTEFMPKNSPAGSNRPDYCAITTTQCVGTYEVGNDNERANRNNQFLAQLLAGLEYAHMNNLLVYPDHNNLCFDASGNLMFKVLGEGDITQQGNGQGSMPPKKKAVVTIMEFLRSSGSVLDLVGLLKFVQKMIK
ncbi:hypothetical protein BDF22DRAFT_653288 [Syncephalis plumigaleata]|nr:hypothetical protein BDF22DRAFT_653288 [Syncephalis plumigaleata]